MTADTRPPEAWLYFALAVVGGYGDAASVVLAKTFTGHVTGSLVLAAIAIAAHKWSALVAHLSSVLFFLVGVILSVLIERALAAWPNRHRKRGREASNERANSAAQARCRRRHVCQNPRGFAFRPRQAPFGRTGPIDLPDRLDAWLHRGQRVLACVSPLERPPAARGSLATAKAGTACAG